jgi:hypothetical protein
MLYKWRKKPGQWRKRSLQIFQTAYVWKVSFRDWSGLSCWPSGNLAAEKADQPKALAGAGDSTWRENSQEYLRRSWEAREIGSSKLIATNLFSYKLLYELLLYKLSSYTLNKGTILPLLYRLASWMVKPIEIVQIVRYLSESNPLTKVMNLTFISAKAISVFNFIDTHSEDPGLVFNEI